MLSDDMNELEQLNGHFNENNEKGVPNNLYICTHKLHFTQFIIFNSTVSNLWCRSYQKESQQA